MNNKKYNMIVTVKIDNFYTVYEISCDDLNELWYIISGELDWLDEKVAESLNLTENQIDNMTVEKMADVWKTYNEKGNDDCKVVSIYNITDCKVEYCKK